MFAAGPRHREHLASEVLALVFGFALDFEVLLSRQECTRSSGHKGSTQQRTMLLPAARSALVDPHHRRRSHITHRLALVLEKRFELRNQRPIGKSPQSLGDRYSHQRTLVLQRIHQLCADDWVLVLAKQHSRERASRS